METLGQILGVAVALVGLVIFLVWFVPFLICRSVRTATFAYYVGKHRAEDYLRKKEKGDEKE